MSQPAPDDSAPERSGPSDADRPDGTARPRGREPVFNLPGVVTALIAACVGIHLVRVYLLTYAQDLALLVRFAFIPLRYSGAYALDVYAFVSPLSYSLLHGSAAHLVVNMVWLAAFGSPLAVRIGNARFLLFWAATALAAVLLHYGLHPLDRVPLIGASGAISGMMGAAARFAFRIDRSSGRGAFGGPILSYRAVLRSRPAVTFLAVWLAINLVTGLGFGTPGMTAEIAWEAHIGGFLAGFFGIAAFDRRPPAR